MANRLSPEERDDRRMLERQLNSRVLYRAKKHSARTLHVQRSQMPDGSFRTGAAKGFPDLLIVTRAGVKFRELKRELGRLDADQEAWRDALLLAGADWAVWRPSDLRSGRVERELSGAG